MNSRLSAIILSLVACVLILFWHQSGTDRSDPPPTLTPVRISSSGTSPAGLLLQVAIQQGHFEAEGLLPVILGKGSYGGANIDALLRGDLDIVTASEVPAMRAGLSGKNVRVIASIGKGANQHVAIVARKDRGIASLADLAGKTLGVARGSNADYFFDHTFASVTQNPKTVRKLQTPPKQTANTLAAGDVDAIVSWFPNWKHAEEELGDNAVTFFGDGLYAVFFNLISTPEFINRNPETVTRLLRVFIRAEKYVDAHPEETKALFKKAFQLSDSVTEAVFSNYTQHVWLGQELILALENEARWSIATGLTKRTEIPNYLKLIHLDSLEKVSPDAVTIIH